MKQKWVCLDQEDDYTEYGLIYRNRCYIFIREYNYGEFFEVLSCMKLFEANRKIYYSLEKAKNNAEKILKKEFLILQKLIGDTT